MAQILARASLPLGLGLISRCSIFVVFFSLDGELVTVQEPPQPQGGGNPSPGSRLSPPSLTPSAFPAFSTACGYFCHSACAPQAPPCPVPPDLLRTALGVHPETGTGTAYEGFLSVSWGWGGGGWRGRAASPAGPPHACLSHRCHGPRGSGGAGSGCSPPSVTPACCCLTPLIHGSARPAGPSYRRWI